MQDKESPKKKLKIVESTTIELIRCEKCGSYLDSDTMYCDQCDIDYYSKSK
jgi:uncharacterized OB-fold protein